MRKVVNKATSKKLSVCVLLILGTLVLDHINKMITFFSKTGDGSKALDDIDNDANVEAWFIRTSDTRNARKREYVFNYIEMILYIIILIICLVSFFR